MTQDSLTHVSVLLKEVLDYAEPVCIRPGSIVVDCTLGLGGHSEAILERFPETKVIGLDKDASLLQQVSERITARFPSRFIAQNTCFSELSLVNGFDGKTLPAADYILADLGISSIQLDNPERGFSFRADGPLDMRMDPSQSLSAHEILNKWDERSLYIAFAEGGVGKYSRPLAKEVILKRPLLTTREFAAICQDVFQRDKRRSTGGAHPATVPFQAVRIAVNNEYAVLKGLMEQSIRILAPRGRFSVISFHSLEDKYTAQAMRWWGSTRSRGLHPEDAPLGVLLNKKSLLPGEEEMNVNSRSRSARMRVFERSELPLWKERALLQ